MFGKNKPGNVFGQHTTPTTAADSGFGFFSDSSQSQQTSSLPVPSLFAPQNTQIFGNSVTGNVPKTGNLLATAGAANETSVFGGRHSFKPVFGEGTTTSETNQPPLVFGGGGSKVVFGDYGIGPGAGAPKKEPATVFDKSSNSSGGLFGKQDAPPSSGGFSFNPTSETNQPSSITKSKPAASGGFSFKPTSDTNQPSSITKSKPAATPNLFKPPEDQKGRFGKKNEGVKSVNPFGGGSDPKPLFGQPAASSSDSPNVFGKPVETKPKPQLSGKMEPVLFGKGSEKSGADLFGKKPDTPSNPFASKKVSSSYRKEVPKTGDLFEKRIISEEEALVPMPEKPVSVRVPRSQTGEARPERSKASGLFGRALADATGTQSRQPIQKQSRVPVQKRQQPDDAAESKDSAKDRKRRSRTDSSLSEKPSREKPKIIVKTASNSSSEPVALVVKSIPASCNNKPTLNRHFSKYGDVTKVFSTPAKSSAVIHFASHEDALQAKKSGRKIKENLPPMQLFWSSVTPSKNQRDEEDASQDNSQQAKTPNVKATLRKSIDSRMKKKVELYDDDELSSLRGTKDTMANRASILRRPSRTGTPEPSSTPQFGSPDRGRARSVSPVRGRGGLDPGSPSRRGRATPPPARSTGAVVSLRSLGDSVAHTAHDFYTILDNRDKLIREAMDLKNRDWARASALKGTCPDMCPERERYMREDRHQLSLYEIIPGTEKVDHCRAVKEYSRSSADQDMPLPHEMRPAEVLDMTMTYLLNNIVDQGRDGMWADWYDFLWNRTRAIRKDITQQHLCDQTTVSLIEKCVRFHIYAGHRLCEEPMNIFDVKINNENLTKCLQTLKELYHDLKVRHNAVCPHEAEFRAYMVLMNLNEGDALREAQQLPPDIRQSPEMNFALRAHAALNENNYVKFFKLVREASFLQGSIIHRYFNQIRKKAIMVLLRAYRSVSATAYPLERVAWLLKFESIEETRDFCEHHGLVVREDCVILEKGAYVDPEAVFSLQRAVQLIESKLMTSVGEAINGAPLPPNGIREPTKSFDSSGRFMISSVPLPKEDIESLTPEKTTFQPPIHTFQPPIHTFQPPIHTFQPPIHVGAQPTEPTVKAADLPFSNEVVKDLTKELFLEVITEMCQELGARFVQDLHIATVAVQTLNTLVPEVTQELTKTVVAETVDEMERAKKEAELRRRAELAAERQASKERASNQLVDEIVESTVASLYQEIAREECSLVDRELRRQSEMKMSEVVSEEILKQEVESEMMAALKEFHQEHVVQRLQQLQQAEEVVRLAFLGRYFHLWKNEAAGRKRLKRVFLTFPAAPNMDPLPQQIQDLVPGSSGVTGNKINLGPINLTLLTPDEVIREQRGIKRSCSAHNLYSKLRHRLAWSPINVGEVILKLNGRGQVPSKGKDGSCYWKGILSLPDERSVPEDFAKWLRTKFAKGSVPTDIPSDNKSELLSLYSVSNTINIANVCVRCINGDLSPYDLQRYVEREDFNAVSAFVHLIFCPPELSTNVEFWRCEEERLDNILGAMPNEDVPVLILLCHDKRNNRLIGEIEARLGLRNIDRDIFNLQELELDVDDSINQLKLQEGLEWLIQQSPKPPNLTVSPVIDVVENMVTLEFSQPVYQDLASRRKTGHLDQPLEILVGFYNDVIEYLAETVSDSDLQNFSWPPPEFATKHSDTLPSLTWNQTKNLEDIGNLILAMRLPEPDLIGVDSWEDGCELVWNFLQSVAEQSTQSSHVELYSRVRWLLRRSRNEMTELCDVLCDEYNSGNELLSPNLPWTEIVMACVRQKLLELKFNPDVSEQQNGLPKVLVYDSKKLGQYQPPELWSSAIRSDVMEEEETLEMSVLRSLKRKMDITDDSPKKSMKVTNVTVLDISPLCPAEVEANQMLHQLEMSVAAGKEESRALDNMLKSALQTENGMSNRSSNMSNNNNSFSNSYIQSQMPMFAVSPREFQVLVSDFVDSPTEDEYRRQSLSDELTDFRSKLQSYKKAQMLESLKLERMLMEH